MPASTARRSRHTYGPSRSASYFPAAFTSPIRRGWATASGGSERAVPLRPLGRGPQELDVVERPILRWINKFAERLDHVRVELQARAAAQLEQRVLGRH